VSFLYIFIMKNKICLFSIVTFLLFSLSCDAKNYPCSEWKTITVNCKVGYIDPEGKVMIAPKFENARNFTEGLAFVWSDENEKEAKKKIPLGEEYHSYDFIENSITGIIDSTGTYIVVPKLNFRLRTPYKNGIATVIINHSVRIINKKGEIIVPYDRQYDKEYRNILLKGRDTITFKWYFLNAYREEVYGPFDGVEEFSENFGAVNIGGKWGYINRQGEMVIQPQFKEAREFRNGHAIVVDQFAVGDHERKMYAVIDTLGRIIMQSFNGSFTYYSEGLGIYTEKDKNGKKVYGFVDSTGAVVIPAKYEDATGFYDGLCAVKEKGKVGYINKKGEWVIQPAYDWGGGFKFGTALIIENNKYGIINREGKMVWGPEPKKDCDD
jgi:hypothetical protein